MNYLKKINLDVSRFIFALMIIAIHIYPLSFISETLDYMVTRVMFRIAVPIFLMITGYYVIPKTVENKKSIINYTKKILKLYLISMLIYLPINIYNGYFRNLSILKLIKDIFIDGTFYHLWYFPALILGLWIVYLLVIKLDKKYVCGIVSLLFIIGILGDNYYGLIKNINILNSIYKFIFTIFEYTRNGLFYTPIFIYMGYLISDSKLKISNKNNVYLMLVFLILMMLEGGILYYFDIPKHSSMYFFLLPLSYLTFNYLISYTKGSNKNLRNIANWIYVLHPLFIVVVHFMERLPIIGKIVSNSLVNYVVVVILTIGFIVSIDKLITLYKNKKNLKASS